VELCGGAPASRLICLAWCGADLAIVSQGFGYVSLDEGGKAYLHRSLLGAGAALGEGFEIGRQIRVTLKPDEKNPGKWAVDTIRDDKPDIDEATVKAAAGIGMTGVADESVLEEGAGVLTDWNSDRQYGFVMILDGPAVERRAYIHSDVLPEAHRPPTVGLHLRVLTKPDPRNPGKIAVAKVHTAPCRGAPQLPSRPAAFHGHPPSVPARRARCCRPAGSRLRRPVSNRSRSPSLPAPQQRCVPHLRCGAGLTACGPRSRSWTHWRRGTTRLPFRFARSRPPHFTRRS
jgi:hypothetical protein